MNAPRPAMRRRTVLAVIAGIIGAGTGGYLWRRAGRRATSRHRQRMRRDFAAGRIYVSDGWYLSAHEVEVLNIESARPLGD